LARMGRKEGGAALGRNLLKAKANTKKGRRVAQQEGYLHTTDLQDGYDWGRLNLQSVTEQDTYTDFMNTAEMAGREFDAEKWNVKLLDAQTRQVYIDTGGEEPSGEVPQYLRIPRRPAWQTMTAEELKEAEQLEFLDWRRELAQVQEECGAVVTPYEKNLDFWRQLWRVVERSDVVVQIVDARHPLLFRCADLEAYVKEVSAIKRNVVLVNKADLLTEAQRVAWAAYLEAQGLDFCFFSALDEEKEEGEEEEEGEERVGDEGEEKEDNGEDEKATEEEEEEGDEEEEKDTKKEDNTEEGVTPAPTAAPAPTATPVPLCRAPGKEEEILYPDTEVAAPPATAVLDCAQLVARFRSYKRHQEESITVGFTGYPNVGKSSTINKLLQAKKVRVSETPGKTKHFQTLVLEEDVTLCDCPGLVMPSVVNCKAGMVLQGILPIHQLKDHVPPMQLLLEFIPSHVLEARYGLVLKAEGRVTVEELLGAYGTLRGFMTQGSRPDQSRAARLILLDYVAGKLLHAEAPPGVEQGTYHFHEMEVKRVFKDEAAKEAEVRRLQHISKTRAEEINEETFARCGLGAHVKGGKKLEGRFSDKGKRKMKARNLYDHLDPKRHGHV